MSEGSIPYYKIRQTYRFAPDEVALALGIPLPAFSAPQPFPSSGILLGSIDDDTDLPGGME